MTNKRAGNDGQGLPVKPAMTNKKAGNDGQGPAMTVFVMPDVIGHLVVAGGEIAGQAGNDGKRRGLPVKPAMTNKKAGNDGKGLPVKPAMTGRRDCRSSRQ